MKSVMMFMTIKISDLLISVNWTFRTCVADEERPCRNTFALALVSPEEADGPADEDTAEESPQSVEHKYANHDLDSNLEARSDEDSLVLE